MYEILLENIIWNKKCESLKFHETLAFVRLCYQLLQKEKRLAEACFIHLEVTG